MSGTGPGTDNIKMNKYGSPFYKYLIAHWGNKQNMYHTVSALIHIFIKCYENIYNQGNNLPGNASEKRRDED